MKKQITGFSEIDAKLLIHLKDNSEYFSQDKKTGDITINNKNGTTFIKENEFVRVYWERVKDGGLDAMMYIECTDREAVEIGISKYSFMLKTKIHANIFKAREGK